jgi:2-C-methyl-D-erythritol 4-phosphate cytidylyltransferase
MITALLTAAGVGSRMNLDIPKQFIEVKNKPLLVYTLEAFQNHPSIDGIVLVTLPSWMDIVASYAKQYGITKLTSIVPGGDTGQDSIYNGLKTIQEKSTGGEEIVMIHDGNRCLISADIISDNLAEFRANGSAVAAIPCVEAVFRSQNNGLSSDVSIPREQLFRTQTPHTYTLEKLLWAHEQGKSKGIQNTAASCVLMHELGETVYFSAGSEQNLKITTVDDLSIFEAIIEARNAHG